MTQLDALLAGIVADPREETRWLVLADWLEENDQPKRAELLRLHRKLLATCLEPDAHPDRAAWQARVVELLVARVKPCVPQQAIALPGGVPMTFSFIPPGAFLMGTSTGRKGHGSEEPVHKAELAEGFFLGTHAVTQEQWAAEMGAAPSHFSGPNRPVEGVSWHECRIFCSRLTATTARRLELPTEAEWEYACRAGTTTEYVFGDTLTPELANYNPLRVGRGSDETSDVGSFPPNPWGLYDTHGNVCEWCDTRFAWYPIAAGGPPRLIPDADLKVVRGGGWAQSAGGCRSATRARSRPDHRHFSIGFRVCLRPD